MWSRIIPRSLFSILRNRGPGFVRIETLHLHKLIERGRPKVLLVDNTILADHEALHPGLAVLGWCRNQSETPDHHAFHHIVHFAEWGGGSLPFENLEKIAMVRLRISRIALFDRLGDLFADWTA